MEGPAKSKQMTSAYEIWKPLFSLFPFIHYAAKKVGTQPKKIGHCC